jgi:hypothetical protein
MDFDDEYVMLLWLLYRRWNTKRRNRRYWIHPIISERREKGFFFYTLWPQLKGDDEKFLNFTKMSQASFNELLGAVQQELTKNTTTEDSIPPEEKLVIAMK